MGLSRERSRQVEKRNIFYSYVYSYVYGPNTTRHKSRVGENALLELPSLQKLDPVVLTMDLDVLILPREREKEIEREGG